MTSLSYEMDNKQPLKEGGKVGRIKAPPVSCFETEECTSTDELLKVCFSGCYVSVSDSCSSVTTMEDDNINTNSNSSEKSLVSVRTGTKLLGTPLYSYLLNGSRFLVNESTVSRQGRECQRWVQDPARSDSLIRLTTGTVPITSDGRILFISSARKKEWILPKGGWENDELMEQSALRETYEEAGLLGFLGPPLSTITFETRKSKKRRLENLEEAKKDSASSVETDTISNSTCASSDDELIPGSVHFDHVCSATDTLAPPRTDSPRICRMTLIPLYLTEVLAEWPENGRARRLFTIDEALDTVTRPELKIVLTEVKEKGLHLRSNSVPDES